MSDFVMNGQEIVSYTGSDKKIVIPPKTTKICAGAFEGCKASSIEMEKCKNLKSIDKGAFRCCAELAGVIFPEGLLSIGECAFENCRKLEYAVIPSSVMVIDNSAFNGCDKLFIAGEEGSEAEKYAKKKKLEFRDPSIVTSVKEVQNKRSNAKVETFKVFGEDVECDKNAKLVKEVWDFYSSKKDKFLKEVRDCIPSDITDQKGDVDSIMKDSLTWVAERLKKKGVVVSQSKVQSYIVEPYNLIIDCFKTIYNQYNTQIEKGNREIQKMNRLLKIEAESKVTAGYTYGVIGSSFDVFMHGLGRALDAAAQAKEANDEARAKSQKFSAQVSMQANNNYLDTVSKVEEYVDQGVGYYIEAMRKTELLLLGEAGLINLSTTNKYDIEKSLEIEGENGTYSKNDKVKIALSLKQFPYNESLIKKTIVHGLEDDGLLEMAKFFGLDELIKQAIVQREKNEIARKKREREKKIYDKYSAEIWKRELGEAIEYVQALDEEDVDKQYLASKLSEHIQELIEKNINKLSNCYMWLTDEEIEEHCTNSVDDAINPESFAKYEKARVKFWGAVRREIIIKHLIDKVKEKRSNQKRSYEFHLENEYKELEKNPKDEKITNAKLFAKALFTGKSWNDYQDDKIENALTEKNLWLDEKRKAKEKTDREKYGLKNREQLEQEKKASIQAEEERKAKEEKEAKAQAEKERAEKKASIQAEEERKAKEEKERKKAEEKARVEKRIEVLTPLKKKLQTALFICYAVCGALAIVLAVVLGQANLVGSIIGGIFILIGFSILPCILAMNSLKASLEKKLDSAKRKRKITLIVAVILGVINALLGLILLVSSPSAAGGFLGAFAINISNIIVLSVAKKKHLFDELQ